MLQLVIILLILWLWAIKYKQWKDSMAVEARTNASDRALQRANTQAELISETFYGDDVSA